MKRLRQFGLAFAGSAAAASHAAAQCSMCAASAAAQSPRAMASLNAGIIFLLIPPVAIMAAILVLAFRYRNSERTAETTDYADVVD